MALRIRRSLSLPELLQSSVDEVQRLLGCDRVLIYRFDADWSGRVVVEAVSDPQWSVVDRMIHDPCFEASWLEPYREKRYFAVEDVATANLTPCHADLLAGFQVQANLVIPIFQEDTLWGLLIAHHCQAPRPWQSIEIEGLHHLALEAGIAIHQATLLEQLQAASRRLEGEVAARIRDLEQTNQALQVANRKLVEEMRDRRMVEVERLQAQTQLQQLSAIVDSSQDAIIGETLKGIVTSWNKAAEAIFGYTADDMIGQPITTIIPPDLQDEAIKILRQIRQGKRIETYETQRLHKNGRRFDVSLTISP
ncbi:MAG: GAF domain-containing protein, partial [Leptolyngbya sp.]|nr:GAF domain-containing protein [Leptolyngbya sp.]